MRRGIVLLLITLIISSSCSRTEQGESYDIIVYGGTSAGVIAAYSASLEGKKVLLIEPGKHLGGLSSSGLGKTDIGNKHAVTGLSRDFYRKLGDYYTKLEAWKFEPGVAERIFNEYVEESDITVLMDYRLVDVKMRFKKIKSMDLENSSDPESDSKTVYARFFIDCSYEGDLMAKAGVSYFVGREANAEYGETYNGVQLLGEHQFPDSIDPYIVPGDPSSGLCWGIQAEGVAPQGSGDDLVQAYNYRLCLTRNKDNMIEISKPLTYDPKKYELLGRVIKQRADKNEKQFIGSQYLIMSPMPNGKTDINNKGAFSTDGIGMNYEYPEGDYETREQIANDVEEYIKGLLYYLGNDSAVIPELRNQMLEWGWAADEFVDNGYFPHQMYVREARRMIGEYVMTEHNCMGDSVVSDGIGLAAYTMDSHNCQRVVVNGMVKNEGDVQIGGFPPYQISYRSLTPSRKECKNLLVPVCLSATHIAYGSIRMEPVFMVLGQVCAKASVMALDNFTSVQDVDVNMLMQDLLTDPLQNGTPPDILVDNADSGQVEIIGNWEKQETWMGQYKADHLIHRTDEANASVTFFPPISTESGNYNAYLYVPSVPWQSTEITEFSQEVTVEVSIGGEISSAEYDFNKNRFDWMNLGSYNFSSGDFVRINASDNEKIVPADALLLVPVKAK